MANGDKDYEVDQLITFLGEEFERIIVRYPRQQSGTALGDAQALAIWFLHQEVGISYDDANKCILDEKNDCGVDFIWEDQVGKHVLIGQVEYESKKWEKDPANEKKAIETFVEFRTYLDSNSLPERLHEAAQNAWRSAKSRIQSEGYETHYYFVTPKHFSEGQRQRIRKKSKLEDYEFFSHDELLERGEEFLDGQTGMSSFKLPFKSPPLTLSYEYGKVLVASVGLRAIHEIVEHHEKSKRLKALFASNVRSYLNVKKRSKEIGSAIRETIEDRPNHFLICNNGITIQCSDTRIEDDHLFLERASISNGCQTVMNINRYFKGNEKANPNADVLVTVIELKKDAANISAEVAIARNNQNPVDNRDLKSNHPLMVTLHHRLFAEKLKGSEKRYYLLRKQGEKQVVIKEERDAKSKYFWIDADELARCITSVLKENPFISKQGTNDIFGKYFNDIFPGINEPSHNRCKYAYWLAEMVSRSYTGKDRWKGVRDPQFKKQKDFKRDAEWIVIALISYFLHDHYSFDTNLENRFVEYCERVKVTKWKPELEEFQSITYEMIDRAFRLLHSIARPLLGKQLPKAKGVYVHYEDLFKGPNFDVIKGQVRKGKSKSYIKRLKRSMDELVEFLKEG